ncbi:hypothetical protein WJX64_11465 [Leifsonia sp. YIM 134122]|uniref:Uncharacterized protein n=1 Tax=Leifsonia stereocauli TaxID=3134136 RepID=A0ABU9W5C1_9MICO
MGVHNVTRSRLRGVGRGRAEGMPARIPLPVHLASTSFRTSDARRAGLGEGRLRGPDLQLPFHGVRTPASVPLTLTERCRAYQLRIPPAQVFSHVTAALLYGLPLPARLESGPLDVASIDAPALPRSRGVRGHRLSSASASASVEVVIWRGTPIVSPVDAWCQLAPLLSERELIVAGDGLLRRHHPLSDIEAMCVGCSATDAGAAAGR